MNSTVTKEMVAELRGQLADRYDIYIPTRPAREILEVVLAMRSASLPSAERLEALEALLKEARIYVDECFGDLDRSLSSRIDAALEAAKTPNPVNN